MIKKIIGGILILASLAFLINQNFTGAIIGTSYISFNLVALAAFIIGIILFIHEIGVKKNLAAQILKSGAIIDDPKKILKIARKMGYDEGREVKEGYQILSHNHPITVVPHHHLSPGVSRNILKTLSSGESNFRRYAHA